MNTPIRVLVADDHAIFRDGILTALSGDSDIEVVGEASGGKEAVAKALELKPDVVLMDLSMPQMGGLAATERIVADNQNIAVVIVTASDGERDLVNAIKIGARGYLIKDCSRNDLVRAVKAAHAGEALLSPRVAAELMAEFKNTLSEAEAETSGLLDRLTDREIEVTRLLAAGLDNKQIAKKLYVSEGTVKNHVSNLLTKLQLENRIQAAALAAREGLV